MKLARSSVVYVIAFSGVFASIACGGAEPSVAAPNDAISALDDARGGRLFDRWAVEAPDATFVPDSSETTGVADGRGGPRGDGTLLFEGGRALDNDHGHDYRLKNLFGWDLRGAAGLYGPEYMDKAAVLESDLLAWPGTVAEVADRLGRGDESVPAFSAVLSRADLEAIALFVVRMRDGALPRAASVYTLTSADAGHYALREGGDAARGHALFAERCAGCHGADGTGHLFDDGAYSLGTHARQKAYEDWLKILNGQPGTPMGRQLRGATAAEMTQELLDLFAALCDRQAFPRGQATGDDVADGDPRCGAYLR
jgi:cytochrome c553